MITKLKNPFSENYYLLKNTILGYNFPWYFETQSVSVKDYCEFDELKYDDHSIFSHVVLKRPFYDVKMYSTSVSTLMDPVEDFLRQVFDLNNIKVSYLLRVNVNCFISKPNQKPGFPHKDHEFPHKNLLIYFTNVGGELVVIDDNKTHHSYLPEEDNIITFGGNYHYVVPQKNCERRICMVVTYV